MKASGLSKSNSDNLIERLELHILETKAGHDGSYNELLNISKRLLSRNIINQEHPDNFVLVLVNEQARNYVGEWSSAKQRVKPTTKIKAKRQLLAKEVFSSKITKFKSERLTPLNKDETWSADLIYESYLKEFNENYIFILTIIDIFTKYAWAIPLKNKSGIYIAKCFKITLSEGRKPENLWVDRCSDFYIKTFKFLLKEKKTELKSTCSDLKAVFIETFNKILLQIINKPLF